MEIEIPDYKVNQTFPQKPGVYLMKDIHEKVIYIGKAKNLNKRIKSYFSNTGCNAMGFLEGTVFRIWVA